MKYSIEWYLDATEVRSFLQTVDEINKEFELLNHKIKSKVIFDEFEGTKAIIKVDDLWYLIYLGAQLSKKGGKNV